MSESKRSPKRHKPGPVERARIMAKKESGAKASAEPSPGPLAITPELRFNFDIIELGAIADRMCHRVAEAAKNDAYTSEETAETDLINVGQGNAEEFLIAGRGIWKILTRLQSQADALRVAVTPDPTRIH